jgi:hypothetical protein
VGYQTIGDLLTADLATKAVLSILIVKSLIWGISLGSGTSGGVLAPLLITGGAFGALLGLVLPDQGAGFWPLVAMGATLGGAISSPFAAIVFAVELTHDFNMLVPLAVAVMTSYGFVVYFLRRSILTEKISRRGLHLSREYAIDPLELYSCADVMQIEFLVLSSRPDAAAVKAAIESDQALFPVLDSGGRLRAAISRNELASLDARSEADLIEIGPAAVVVAYANEPLRVVTHRMAATGFIRMPVVDPLTDSLVGLLQLRDVLKAYARNLHAEEIKNRNPLWRSAKLPVGG